MKLHEAIKNLLINTGKPLTTSEIATMLNKNKWYIKKDKSGITPFQIHGRAKNYPEIFIQKGTIISLNKIQGLRQIQPKKPTAIKNTIRKDSTFNAYDFDIETRLMKESNYKNAGLIDAKVPISSCGIYCIRIDDINCLPPNYSMLLKGRKHNILYIGKATGCLNTRFLKQELRANGHGTFFRSLGAVLGYKPPKGSLLNKINKRNYKFSSVDNIKIIGWINKHLKVNWIEYNGDLDKIERFLIKKYIPLLNIAHNPSALSILSAARADCVRIASSH